jgi:hypothetical protein
MIELFDWYNNHGQQRGPGFLVQAVRNPNSIAFPSGFESSEQAAQRRAAENSRIKRKRVLLDVSDAEQQQNDNRIQTQFQTFWDGLSPTEQVEFEDKAIELADATKRLGYYRYQGREGKLFQQYRNILLRDHFARSAQSAGTR